MIFNDSAKPWIPRTHLKAPPEGRQHGNNTVWSSPQAQFWHDASYVKRLDLQYNWTQVENIYQEFQLSVVVYAYNPRIWEVETGKWRIKCQPWLQSKFKTNLHYIKACLGEKGNFLYLGVCRPWSWLTKPESNSLQCEAQYRYTKHFTT